MPKKSNKMTFLTTKSHKNKQKFIQNLNHLESENLSDIREESDIFYEQEQNFEHNLESNPNQNPHQIPSSSLAHNNSISSDKNIIEKSARNMSIIRSSDYAMKYVLLNGLMRSLNNCDENKLKNLLTSKSFGIKENQNSKQDMLKKIMENINVFTTQDIHNILYIPQRNKNLEEDLEAAHAIPSQILQKQKSQNTNHSIKSNQTKSSSIKSNHSYNNNINNNSNNNTNQQNYFKRVDSGKYDNANFSPNNSLTGNQVTCNSNELRDFQIRHNSNHHNHSLLTEDGFETEIVHISSNN